MSVNKSDRRESKVEFDNTYFKIYRDAVNLVENRFGSKDESKRSYISFMSSAIMRSVTDLGTYIRIANSIYPTCNGEYAERRIAQDKAIGLCYDLMTKYQLVLSELHIPDDKYTNEIKQLIHEINCLKKWRSSDNERFRNLG